MQFNKTKLFSFLDFLCFEVKMARKHARILIQNKSWRRCKTHLSSASVKNTLLAIGEGGGLWGKSAKLKSEKNLCANLAMSAGTRATVPLLVRSSRVAANDFFCCNCPDEGDDAVGTLSDLSWETLFTSLQLLINGEGNRGSFLRVLSAVPSTWLFLYFTTAVISIWKLSYKSSGNSK